MSDVALTLRHPPQHALVVGASGGIGQAIARRLIEHPEVERVVGTTRSLEVARAHPKMEWRQLDLVAQESIAALAKSRVGAPPFSMIVVASGILHGADLSPERSYRQIEERALSKLFAVNAVGPALVAKHLIGHLDRNHRSIFACLGARIGSIGDNRAGGWYGYRASKAALVMTVKTLSIEMRRTHPEAIALTLHPGTVRSALSAPFVRPNSARKTFSAQESADKLLRVMDQATQPQSGEHLAYDGSRIEP